MVINVARIFFVFSWGVHRRIVGWIIQGNKVGWIILLSVIVDPPYILMILLIMNFLNFGRWPHSLFYQKKIACCVLEIHSVSEKYYHPYQSYGFCFILERKRLVDEILRAEDPRILRRYPGEISPNNNCTYPGPTAAQKGHKKSLEQEEPYG